MSKVRIVGLGTMSGRERCIFTEDIATGYVEDVFGDMVPVRLSILGPGKLGELVELPTEYRKIAKEKLVINWSKPFIDNGLSVVDSDGDKYMDCTFQQSIPAIVEDLNNNRR